MTGSLAGIKVLDLSRLLPGPYCSMLLADHGAEVISIEDKRFREDGLFFETLYRNKKHLSLNLKSKRGKAVFYRLAADADIIIEGFRPGVAARLGVDFTTIHKSFPRIIYCSITGYGQDGPYRDRAGHDVNYLATAGILDLIGPADGPPSIPGVQIADIGGGSMNAVIGILLALVARNHSGTGQFVDISMTDGLLGFLSLPHYFHHISGQPLHRSRELLSHRYACYNTYETRDGSYIAVGALENRFWKHLCTALHMDMYAELQFDEAMRETIIDRFRDVFRQRSAAAWEAVFGDEDVCCCRVVPFQEALDHPLFKARGMVADIEHGDGQTVRTFGIGIRLSATPGSFRTPPAQFGQHNHEILAELGYSEAEIERLRADNII
ncbi:MAG: CoA transferase [Desulfofustis sp.]|nr:CoA transferase [Desulfofustis sp.]